MNILEIAVYAAVLSAGNPVLCHLEEDRRVECSNGRIAQQISEDTVRFEDGTVVARGGKYPLPRFSNGVKSWLGSSGWMQFSNGIGVRRVDGGSVLLSNGVVCRVELPDLIDCDRRHGKRGG